MESPIPPSHLTLSDVESQIQSHSDLEALYFVKEPIYLGPMLLLNINIGISLIY